MARHTVVVMAGPNGSGKSTCAELLLPDDMVFLNADNIAQEITGERSTTADLQAGRLLISRMDEMEAQDRDFAIETTLATRTLEARINRLRDRGYHTHLFFLYLPSEELALQRVAARVRTGGHSVPDETVRRRYRSGLRLFFSLYQRLFDHWRMYDNSRIADPRLIAAGTKDQVTESPEPSLFELIRTKWTQ